MNAKKKRRTKANGSGQKTKKVASTETRAERSESSASGRSSNWPEPKPAKLKKINNEVYEKKLADLQIELSRRLIKSEP